MKHYTACIFSILYFFSQGQSSWTLSNTGIPAAYTPYDFAIASNNDVYLGAAVWNNVFSPRLMKSVNNGVTWSQVVMNGLPGSAQIAQAITFCGTKMLLASDNAVFSSSDNGSNWALSGTGLDSGFAPLDFAVNMTGEVYVVGTHPSNPTKRLYKSVDCGVTWAQINAAGLQNVTSVLATGTKLFAGGSLGIQVSGDDGATWSASNNAGNIAEIIAAGTDLYAVAEHWNGATLVTKVIRSIDGGNTWSVVTLTGIGNMDLPSGMIFSNNIFLLCGSSTSSMNSFVLRSKPASPPSISTSLASAITLTSAVCGGNVSYDGGGPVTARGVCFATQTNPTFTDAVVNASSAAAGSYTVGLAGLLEGTIYYARAFATNQAGTTYGQNIMFKTLSTIGVKEITRDKILELSPVPAADILYVVTQEEIPADICDLTGTVFTTVILKQGDNAVRISGLPPGIYFLHLPSGASKKSIKQ